MDNFVELISKPIADALFPFVYSKLVKDKMYNPERNTRIYNALYNFVSETVTTYFEENTFTTKEQLDADIEIIVENLVNLLFIDNIVIPNTCPSGCSPTSSYCSPNCDIGGCCLSGCNDPYGCQ